LQSGELPWGRQAVLLLKMATSFNNNSSVGSASSSASFQAGASASPSVSRGGEGMGCRSILAFFTEATEVESEGMWLPRCVTSPTRGPVLPAHLWPTPCPSTTATRVLSPARRLLLRAGLICPPPPACGRCGEFDCGSLCIDDGDEGSSPVCSVLQLGSGDTFSSSILATAGDFRPTSKAML
jgi:hypothetical protein